MLKPLGYLPLKVERPSENYCEVRPTTGPHTIVWGPGFVKSIFRRNPLNPTRTAGVIRSECATAFADRRVRSTELDRRVRGGNVGLLPTVNHFRRTRFAVD